MNAVTYESVVTLDSQTLVGVSFSINRISFGRRIELSKRIREISQQMEFLAAGSQLQEKIDANILSQDIDAMYLRWGLVAITGLLIDGESATYANLIEKGPEGLVREIVSTIKEQCGLNEAELKN